MVTRQPEYLPGGRACTIVLNWNRPVDTLACLESLLPSVTSGKSALLVCDNGSSDDSVARIRDWAERRFRLDTGAGGTGTSWDFMLIRSPDNRGFAGGNNLGIRQALSAGFAYLWILNNDTEVAAGAIEALLRCADGCPDALIIGSTVLDFDRRDTLQYPGGARYFVPLSLLTVPHRGRSYGSILQASPRPNIDYVAGCAMFCRSTLFEQYGLFDEDFFLYFEELDLASRLTDRRRRLHWCRDSVVYHKEGRSAGGRSTANPRQSALSSYHENLSALLYTRRHHKRWLLLVLAARFTGKLTALLAHRRPRLLSPLLSAYVDFFRGRTGRSDSDIGKEGGAPEIVCRGIGRSAD